MGLTRRREAAQVVVPLCASPAPAEAAPGTGEKHSKAVLCSVLLFCPRGTVLPVPSHMSRFVVYLVSARCLSNGMGAALLPGSAVRAPLCNLSDDRLYILNLFSDDCHNLQCHWIIGSCF